MNDLMFMKKLIDDYYKDSMMDDLIELSKNEPDNSTQRHILRCAIMGYELGAIQQAIVRDSSDLPDHMKNGHIENGKLGMADLITQCKMLCLDMGWDYRAIERLGVEHLRERQKDFMNDEGWCEAK